MIHRHKWRVLRVTWRRYSSGHAFTETSQQCLVCGKTRRKAYSGHFNSDEIDERMK